MIAGVRRVRIDLAYDGTDFSGWQYQPGRRSVQGVLEQALAVVQGGGSVRVRGAGRTDAGVHARRQTADGLFCGLTGDDELLSALRELMPRDVRPLAVRTVPATFHSQWAAITRSYRYQLDRTRHGDPFRRRYALHRHGALDAGRIEAALALLPGRRDWSGFAGAAGVVRNPVRTVLEARYGEPDPETGWFTFTADGYLNYMVRNIVGTVIEIAAGRFEPRRIGEILESCDRRLAGATAAAHGLFLWKIEYPEVGEVVADRRPGRR